MASPNYLQAFIISVLLCCSQGLLLHTEDDLLSAYQALSQKVAAMESTISKLQTNTGTINGGANYVRWGRTTCPGNGTSLVYDGFTAGSEYHQTGGAANYMCLPAHPQWDYYEDSVASGAKIYGTEYESLRLS